MKTDDFIDLLAREEPPARSRSGATRTILAASLGLALAAFIVAATLRVRADLGDSVLPVVLKAGFAAAFAAAALPIMLRLWRPGRPLGRRAYAIVALAVVAFGAVAIALAGVDPQERLREWTGGGFPWCVVIVPILAAPTAALTLWIARDFAPTDLTRAGAAIGAFSGGVGAMAYAMYCPVDSVAFVATWYAVAIGLCAALGAALGRRLLRW